MKRAIVRVSEKLLQELLFPNGTKIIRVLPDPAKDIRYFVPGEGTIEIVVEHKNLPIVAEGDMYPYVSVEFDGKIKKWEL